MTTPKRLFVIDCMALAFRSFYAIMRPMTTSGGTPTSAVLGSANFLSKLITEQKPDYLVAATDSREPTFRHALYDKYKANRTAMPPDLAAQLPHFFQLFDALGIKVLRESGLEADDLIGSIALEHAGPGLEVKIVSGDKDFMQLVNEHVSIWRPKKGDEAEIIDVKGVFEKFGVTPAQVIDTLAIMGDTSDNVPGVHGIGEKGAAKLINEYGSLEAIYANLDKVANKKHHDALAASRDNAFLSQKLVTIKRDCSGMHPLADYAFDGALALANDKLLKLYRDLEFRVLATKVEAAMAKAGKTPAAAGAAGAAAHRGGAGAPPRAGGAAKTGQGTFGFDDGEDGGGDEADAGEQAPDAVPVPHAAERIDPGPVAAYVLVNTQERLSQLMTALSGASEFVFDTETTGLDILGDRAIGMSFAVARGGAFYLPLLPQHLGDGLTPAGVLAAVRGFLESGDAVKIGHNLKFDLQMLENAGLEPEGPFRDTMVMDWLLDATARTHGLDACCLKHLNYEKIKTSTLIGDKGEKPMADAPLDELTRYACEDADLTLRLYHFLRPRIGEKGLDGVLVDVEMPLLPILARMERYGVFVDTEVLGKFSDRLKILADEYEQKIYELAGERFNINSPKQLGTLLFEKLKLQEKLGIKGLKKTKTGYSTDESVLVRLSGHPLPKAILEYRSVTKLKNTYVDMLPQLVNPKDNRIHTSFHQTGTATGRLSSSDPNLQNIPIRTELGQEIRKAFKASSPDSEIVSADYSQIELRLLAHLAGEEALTKAFNEGADIHRITAAKVLGIAPELVDGAARSKAKAINFGIIYGMGPRRLAQQTGVSLKEAADFIAKYFASYPRIERFVEDSIQNAKDHGGSRTMLGRFRPIDGLAAINGRDANAAENIAVNSPLQGSAADLIKLAMIKVDGELKRRGLNARMLLQVHDELVFECPRGERAEVELVIADAMRGAMQLAVPLEVSIGHGDNWLAAH